LARVEEMNDFKWRKQRRGTESVRNERETQVASTTAETEIEKMAETDRQVHISEERKKERMRSA